MTLATQGIRPQDAGVASAMVNTSQQVGGSIGTALLNTIAAGATTTWITANATGNATADATAAAVHGYVTAFWWALGIMLLAALLVAVLVRTDGRTPAPAGADTRAAALPVVTH